MLPALAFLPVGAITEAFQGMLKIFPQEAIELADYFEGVYVGRPRRNGIWSAQFPPKLWSMYESAPDGMPRTNNSVEAWYYGLQRIEAGQASIQADLQALKQWQASVDVELKQLSARIREVEVDIASTKERPEYRCGSRGITNGYRKASVHHLKKIDSRFEDTENRMRRSNLLFFGIPDVPLAIMG
ncbi:hypothetical protein HPB48_013567 [Haemaphysalis longicornis]|uniref:Uncharacterized protein n=1 Tax=Haemaphysalis longicornis TaxID=44386 RepID=A0A9J6GKR8_HAELO|nr:hypothetical protein HPB48_013567 [Haemaphysalis longicornis]